MGRRDENRRQWEGKKRTGENVKDRREKKRMGRREREAEKRREWEGAMKTEENGKERREQKRM